MSGENDKYYMASASPKPSPGTEYTQSFEDGPEESLKFDSNFIDDLVAANRLKSFLIVNGFDVPKETIAALAELSFKFSKEMRFHELREEKIHEKKSSVIQRLFRSFV